MPPLARQIVVLAALLMLAACRREGAPSADADLPPVGAPDAQVAVWEGLLACADCDGIRMRLLLERDGSPARYRLTEVYLTGRSGEHFEEQGRWRRDGRLLRLRSEHGGERVFALEPDGALSLRDRTGRLPADGAPRLLPAPAPD